MKIVLVIAVFYSFYLFADPNVWVNNSNDLDSYKSFALQDDGILAAEYFANQFAKRAVDQSLLLGKIDQWSKSNLSANALETEMLELRKYSTLSSSNRLALFEYLKNSAMNGTSFKYLCHLYANDSYLKTAEPFFDSSCALTRFSLKELNPTLMRFDILLIDGNKIDIQQNPFFYSSGIDHQFIFISDRFVSKEFTGTANTLRHAKVTLDPWVSGECNQALQNHTNLSTAVKAYFSKDCVSVLTGTESNQQSFLGKNRYYILSGILVALAGAYIGSQFELGFTLP